MDTVFIALRVLVVLGVIVTLLWYVQRRLTKGKSGTSGRGGRVRRGNAVTVVGRQGVGSKASVVVVDVDGTRFVLGVTERAVNVLHSGERPIDLEAEVTRLNPVRKTFAKPIERTSTTTTENENRTPTQDASSDERPRQDAEYLNAQQRASVFDEALKGSILSPATWRQASSAVRPRK
ncbi:FliO/MopB family protein [Leifsonia poae]|uniref:FliO/MopB family protein n=1 Tax=Leifsonia poae TaxID=110933 RepID=UPI003D66FD3D